MVLIALNEGAKVIQLLNGNATIRANFRNVTINKHERGDVIYFKLFSQAVLFEKAHKHTYTSMQDTKICTVLDSTSSAAVRHLWLECK